MIFYHGTSKEHWDEIQKDGFLFGRRFVTDNNGKIIREIDRCTYLATDLDEAKRYGDIVLKVRYDPRKNESAHNYFDDECWQIRVYEPIPLADIEVLKS